MSYAEIVPRSPLSRGKSGSIDYPDDYQRQMLRWRETARQKAHETLNTSPELANISTYIKYLLGNQWSDKRPKYRSRYYDNRLQSVRRETLALLTDVRPIIEVSSPGPYQEQARIVRNVILAEWTRLNMELKLVQAVDHALIGGVGFWKIGAVYPGQMVVTSLGIDSVLPIEPGLDIQESSGVLYTVMKPLVYFMKKWPHRIEAIRKYASSADFSSEPYERPAHIPEYTWASYSPQIKRTVGIPKASTSLSPSAYGMVRLEEFYIDDPAVNESPYPVEITDPEKDKSSYNYWYRVDPGSRLFPRKRLIIFAGDEILYDGTSPYWHGLYPFAALVLDPVVFSFYGLSKYRPLMPIQDAINEIGAGTMDAIKRALNPPRIARMGTMTEEAWRRFFPDLPGAELQLNPTADPSRDVRFLDPPILPSYVFGFLASYLLPSLDRHAGSFDPYEFRAKKQTPGGETIEQMRSSMQHSFRLDSRYIEAFLRDAGEQAVANVFQFFNKEQRMKILGPDGLTLQDFDYNPSEMAPWSEPREEHYRNFTFNVVPGSLLGSTSDRAKILAVQLYAMGAISRRELLRRLDIGEVERIEEEIAQERERGLGPLVRGRTPRLTRGQRTGSPV